MSPVLHFGDTAVPDLQPLRAVVQADVCISVAGAVAWGRLECGHVLRFAGLLAMGTQRTRQRRCHLCPRVEIKPNQGELFA